MVNVGWKDRLEHQRYKVGAIRLALSGWRYQVGAVMLLP
jgi:hypothetical protein